MTRDRKTAKETNEQKWKRMKLIMDKLKETSMSTVEIEQLISDKSPVDRIVKRTIQNYMAELIALGLVEYDSEAGVYKLTENKKDYPAKLYNIVMKHCKNLVFSTRTKRRLDEMDPYLVLDLLAYGEKEIHDLDDLYVLQHVKTGYPTVYSRMRQYRQKMDEMDLSKGPNLPKLRGTKYDFRSDGFGKDRMIDWPGWLAPSTPEHETLPKIRKDIKELYDLRDRAVLQIKHAVIKDVENGDPLKGYCEKCPDRRFTIRSKS